MGIVPVGGAGDGRPTVDYDGREYQWQIPADISYSIPFNGDFRSLTRFTLTPLSLEDEYNFFGLFLAGDIIDLKTGSLPDLAVDNVWMLESGITYRRYLSPPRALFNPYVTVSAASQLLVWSYRTPVISGGDTIRSDELEGVGGYVGVGLAVLRNKPLSFFGEVGVGGTVFLDTTLEDFRNNVFNDFGYFSVKAGLSLKF